MENIFFQKYWRGIQPFPFYAESYAHDLYYGLFKQISKEMICCGYKNKFCEQCSVFYLKKAAVAFHA